MSWYYYRLIPIGGKSEALLLERYDYHKNVLKGFISLRRVRRKPQISIPFPLRISSWFAEHKELLEYFPNRVLIIIPFNIDSEEDIDVLMDIVKSLYGLKDPREFKDKVKAGRVRPIEAGLEPHYRLFLNAKSIPKIPIDTLYDVLREASSEETENSTP
jgi:hypothetical protein